MDCLLLDSDIKEQFAFRVLVTLPMPSTSLEPRFSAVYPSPAKGKTHFKGDIKYLFLILPGNFAF